MDSPAERIKSRVLTVMQEDGRTRFPFTAALLGALSRAYGLAVSLRAARYARGRARAGSPACRVISVGNLTVGGTGKTPMTLYLAELAQRLGVRVAVVSRGYRGRAERRGAVVSDGGRILLGPEEAGDEAFMMAAALPGVPVIVGRDRCRAAMTAVDRFGSRVVVLDDGFQHLRLRRDLDIVLLDARRPLGNGRLLPRGPLREQPSALKRAGAVVLTRSGSRPGKPQAGTWPREIGDRPLFRCGHVPQGCWVAPGSRAPDPAAVLGALAVDPAMLAGRRVLVFSGIAGNRGFLETVVGLGASVVDCIAFGDHHRYGPRDWGRIRRRALASGADALATTCKDYVKLARRPDWPLPAAVIDVRVRFDGSGPAFDALVRRAMGA